MENWSAFQHPHPMYRYDACPWCDAPFLRTVIRERIDAVPVGTEATSCVLGICHSCVHVVAIYATPCRRHIEVARPEREWLKAFDPRELRNTYEIQERMHHDRGHWG